jgi:deoxyribonuclease V
MPNFHAPHPWRLPPSAAIALQKELASQVITHDQFGPINLVAGVDVGFEENNTIGRAAVAVLTFPSLQLVDYAIARRPTEFPYIPGLLSFREIPVVLDAMNQLQLLPDIILCDGQGLAHPRRFGIACHLGIITSLPAIGVGKSRLIGKVTGVPAERGQWSALEDRGARIGAVLRSRAGTLPIYVSIGHKISLESAIERVMRCTTRYKLPETTRWAHRLASGPLDAITPPG